MFRDTGWYRLLRTGLHTRHWQTQLPTHHYSFMPGVSTWCVQVLRSPKEAFAAAMQSWRERCEKMCMSTG